MSFARVGRPSVAGAATGKFQHGSDLTTSIRAVLSGDRKDVAVAFWGAAPLKRLGISDASKMRVACDLYSGACNPTAIKDLLDAGASVFDVAGLHAKVYLGSTAMVVGSANVSANGLGEEGVEIIDGFEAGIVSDTATNLSGASEWFVGLLAAREPIGPEALPELKRLWSRRRHGRPKRSTGTLVEAMARHDPMLRHRAFKMVVYTAEEPTSKVKKAYKAHDSTPIKEGDPYPHFLTRWAGSFVKAISFCLSRATASRSPARASGASATCSIEATWCRSRSKRRPLDSNLADPSGV